MGCTVQLNEEIVSTETVRQCNNITELWAELREKGLEESFGEFMAQHALSVLFKQKYYALRFNFLEAAAETERVIAYVLEFQAAVHNQF